MYLVMQDGDVKRGAGNTVYLLDNLPALHSTLRDICARYAARAAEIDRAYAAANREADRSSRDPHLAESVVRAANRRVSALNAEKATLSRVADQTISDALLQRVVARSGTGVNGHYRFDAVTPGTYRLYATTRIGTFGYTWWAAVELGEGGTVLKDLDNSVVLRASGQKPTICHAGAIEPRPTPAASEPQT